MEPQVFTPSELDNLQRLIDENQPADDLIKDDEIKDSDILFFSQFGHLDDTPEDQHFKMLPGISDVTTNDLHVNPREVSQGLQSESSLDLSQAQAQINNSVVLKKEPFLNFAQAKYKEMDGKSTRIFECGICGKEFAHQYTLMRHLPTHTDERKFHCLTCGKSFRQMSTLSQHRAIHSSERPYICEVCNKNFNRVSTLISHRKTHTGIKPHRCYMCNKAFHQKGNLRNHIFTHTNERPYKCDICNKGFNQMSNLMCHKMKAHQHQNDSIPRYRCEMCGAEFLKRLNLRQHEQFKHGMASAGEARSITDYSNAIIVDPIKTDAMKMAMHSGDTPFALLRPLSGIPVLVRVIPAGDKQMLVPATAEDLKKYGHISIRPKVPENKSEKEGNKENQAEQDQKSKGCIVQIKVPVVATVIQKTGGLNDSLSLNVVSPSPGDILDERGGNMGDLTTDSFVYTSTLMADILGDDCEANESRKSAGADHSIESFAFDDKYDNLIGSVTANEIQFVSHTGNDVTATNLQRSLDMNSMEFTFDIPQDAREEVSYPPRVSAINELIMINEPESHHSQQPVAASENNFSHLLSPVIPDKFVLEENGHYIEI